MVNRVRTMESLEIDLEKESAELDGYISDAPLNPKPKYPELRSTFETSIILLNLPKVRSLYHTFGFSCSFSVLVYTHFIM